MSFSLFLICVDYFFRFTDLEMEILEKATFLHNKFSSLNVNKEEYVIMKVINYLNQGKNNIGLVIMLY